MIRLLPVAALVAALALALAAEPPSLARAGRLLCYMGRAGHPGGGCIAPGPHRLGPGFPVRPPVQGPA